MRLDSSLCFSENQALSTSSDDSTNTVNIRKAGIAESQDVYVVVRNKGAVTNITSVTVKGSSDNSTFATLVTVPVTDLTDGGGVNIKLPQGCPQYMKLNYVGSSTMTGNVDAYISLQPDSIRGKRITDYAAQS